MSANQPAAAVRRGYLVGSTRPFAAVPLSKRCVLKRTMAAIVRWVRFRSHRPASTPLQQHGKGALTTKKAARADRALLAVVDRPSGYPVDEYPNPK